MTNPHPPETKRPLVDKETLIPVGLAMSLLLGAFIIGGEWKATGIKVKDLESEVDGFREEFREFREDYTRGVLAATEDRWKRTWMKTWRDDLQARNPEVDVPEIRDF